MSSDFDAFFHDATGNTPYDYQRRLAGPLSWRVQPAVSLVELLRLDRSPANRA